MNGRSPLPHIRGYVHDDGRVLTRSPFNEYIWADQKGVMYSPAALRGSEVDRWLRGRGFRPVFTKRPFHAKARGNGFFLLECRMCGTRVGGQEPKKPHDMAVRHATWRGCCPDSPGNVLSW